ncbi:MAG: hypothetical protein ACKORM_03445 [Solirubrobacterales bacterium]
MANPIKALLGKLRRRRTFVIASPIEEANRPGQYPDGVETPEQRKRWDAARLAALKVAESIGGDEYTVYLTTRSLYNSDIPTE